MDWAKPKEPREQMVLFPNRLDQAIRPGHRVRAFDEILGHLDWSEFEAEYDLTRGQPPIHPRVLAGVIVYGLLVRIRSSRALEEALEVRLDFRWLAEGRSIDHTTICKFRLSKSDALQNLFVQVGLVARQMGHLPLSTLAYDGTRMRSNNRRSGTRTPDELRELKKRLAAQFDELEAQAKAADQAEDERFGSEGKAHVMAEELCDVTRRQKQIEAALAELERIAQSGEDEPKRLPISDPDSRIMPNKDGGYAPNYTPTATVDVDSGMIVAADVLNNINEDHGMVPSIKEVQENFGLATAPEKMLADGLMATGENLAACAAEGIELYSPIKLEIHSDNPAIRDDLTQPVAAEDRDRLPTKPISRGGNKTKQLDKAAFVFDAETNSYWCPEGKRLAYSNTTREKTKRGATRVRDRYVAQPDECAACPLKSLCLTGRAKSRSINREGNESLREAHAAKMSTADAKAEYVRRAPVNERPFAVIKQQFGVRQLLLRGLDRVRKEWIWITTAFNIHRLMGLSVSGAGPPLQP